MLPRNKLLLTDCVEGMKELPDDGIPLTVTSPPYDKLREYGGHEFTFPAVAEQLWRVTAPGGVVVWVVDDEVDNNGSESGTSAEQKLAFRDLGFTLHETLYVYRGKPRHRYRHFGVVDEAFVLSKGKPSVVTPRRVPTKWEGSRKDFGDRRHDGTLVGKPSRTVNSTRQRAVVWHYGTGRHTAEEGFIRKARHGGLMLEQLARDLILTYSRPSDLVFDPMAGLGTTCKMALLNHRSYLGMEITPEYVELAQRRLDLAHRRYLEECRGRLSAVS